MKSACPQFFSIFSILPAFVFMAGSLHAASAPMELKSHNIQTGQMMPLAQVYGGMGAGGRNVSPGLSWKNVPRGTKSLAVTMHDPDAPRQGGWWHWLVLNIPPKVSSMWAGASRTGQMPRGAVETVTDFGTIGYGGAAPPVGDKPHRYVITLWALDVESLAVDADTPPAQVEDLLKVHKLATATIIPIYAR